MMDVLPKGASVSVKQPSVYRRVLLSKLMLSHDIEHDYQTLPGTGILLLHKWMNPSDFTPLHIL